MSTTIEGVSFRILGKNTGKTGNFGLSDGRSAVRKPDFSFQDAKTIEKPVYFLRFFTLQRTPKKYGVGGFEPKQRLYTKKGINITSITEVTLKAHENGDRMLRFDVAYLLAQVYRTSLDEIEK